MPSLPPASDFNGAANQAAAQTAYGNQRAFLAGLLGTDGLPATALATLGALGSGFSAKTGAYTATTADRGKLIQATSGTWTLSLPAAATAGLGFSILVRNSGSGVITLDGNGSETINGATTVALQSGSGVILLCTGSAWFALDMAGPGQAAADDATAGTVLRNFANGGSFGLGNTGTLRDIGNLDTISAGSGWYRMTSSTTGTRPTGVSGTAGGLVEHLVTSAGNLQQTLRLNNPAAGFAGIYRRQYFSGAWTAWDVAQMRSDILGTVSQSGGVPTGAVIEAGANANGQYTKFADGTMLCRVSGLSAPDVNTAAGNIWRSADVAWTFPAPFASATHLIVLPDCDNADCWATANSVTASGCNIRALGWDNKVNPQPLRAQATGRWF